MSNFGDKLIYLPWLHITPKPPWYARALRYLGIKYFAKRYWRRICVWRQIEPRVVVLQPDRMVKVLLEDE